MDRRRILLIAAAIVAALGTVMVFVYVQGAEARAAERFETVPVLEATAVIEPGETIEDALAGGKIVQQEVVADARLSGALADAASISGTVALTSIYPGEQIIAEKFGETAATGPSLNIPDTGELAISVNLTDPARVAGFVRPGSEVAIFLNGTNAQTGLTYTRLLLERVSVLGVGSTTPVSTTTTDAAGQQTVEQLPSTLVTLSLTQEQAERVLYAQSNGELAFALLTEDSVIKPGDAVDDSNVFAG